MVTRLLCVALVVLTAVAGRRAVAASPDDTFQQLYGDQVRKLKADRGKGDVDFAKKLLSDAKDVPDDKPFRALLCTKAYEFASAHADGYGIAAEAMELLAKTNPESEAAALDKALEMYEKRYTAAPVSQRKTVGPPYLGKLMEAADAKANAGQVKEATTLYNKALKVAESVDRSRVSGIRDAMKDLGAKQAAQKHLDELLAKLKANPDDAATANEVIQILVYERNRPADAVEVAAALKDPAAKRAIPLAAKDPADLGEPELIDLAEWHAAQAAKASDSIKALALERADACYAQFLKIHTAEDADKLKAKRASDEVQHLLVDAEAKSLQRTVDLLKLINPARDGVKGTWKWVGVDLEGKNLADSPAATLRIPYQPTEEYDFKVEFTRLSGEDSVAQILSHGGHTFLSVEGGWANTITGIEMIGGKASAENPTTRKVAHVLAIGTRYVVITEVRKDSITLKIDGAVVAHYVTNYSDMSLYKPLWDLGDGGKLGIGGLNGTIRFHSIQLRKVGGGAK